MEGKHIPHDVIADNILTRLPAKCLGRYKCVSKAWRSHIEHPKFVKFHHDLSLRKQSNLSLIITCGSSLYILHGFLDKDDNTPRRRVTPLVLPPSFAKNSGLKIVGSHNGLICIGSGKTLNNYFVFNPNMPRNPKILPFAQNVFSRTFGGKSLDYLQGRCITCSGFGYDHIGELYKLVYIFILTTDRDPQPEGLVYNSKTGSWTRLEPPVFVEQPMSIDQWVFCGELNNSLHFVGQRDKNVIITFDLHNEIWGEMSLPCCEQGYEVEKEEYELEEGYEIKEVYEVIDACILRDCLSALVIDHGCKYPSFWVLKDYMKEDSWTKLFTLPIVRNFRMLYYLLDIPLVLLLHEGYGVVWYDYKEGNITEIIEIEKGSVGILDCRVVFAGSLNPVPGVRPRQELVRKGDGVERSRIEFGREKDQPVRDDEGECEDTVVKESCYSAKDRAKKETAKKKKMKKLEKMKKKNKN